MTEKTKSGALPYATFPTFVNFLNKLRDTTVPSRIDPTVFGGASGSVAYSILAALKSLKLIDAEGTPTKTMVDLVKASDEARKPIIGALVHQAYPSFFGGKLDVAKASAGQLDEHIRTTYDASGSTVDKVAAFFIAAALFAGIELSPHIKARKSSATSASSGKSKKQRRANAEVDVDDEREIPAVVTVEPKALEYQLIDLLKAEGIGNEEQSAIWTLVRFLATPKVSE